MGTEQYFAPAGNNDANNGTFYGTANQLWNRTSYMVWGNNSGGATVAYLNITVVDQVPAISYSPANLILTNNTNSTHFHLRLHLQARAILSHGKWWAYYQMESTLEMIMGHSGVSQHNY